MDPEDNTEVNGIRGVLKPQGIGTVVLDLEDNKGKISQYQLQKCLLLTWGAQDTHQPSEMGPIQRIIQSCKERAMIQCDGQALHYCVEQRENPK